MSITIWLNRNQGWGNTQCSHNTNVDLCGMCGAALSPPHLLTSEHCVLALTSVSYEQSCEENSIKLTINGQKRMPYCSDQTVDCIEIHGYTRNQVNCGWSPQRLGCASFSFYSDNLCSLSCRTGCTGYFYSEKGGDTSQAEGPIHDQNAMAFIISQLTPKWLTESWQMAFSLAPCFALI